MEKEKTYSKLVLEHRDGNVTTSTKKIVSPEDIIRSILEVEPHNRFAAIRRLTNFEDDSSSVVN